MALVRATEANEQPDQRKGRTDSHTSGERGIHLRSLIAHRAPRARWRAVAGLVVGSALLVVAIRGIEPRQVLGALSQADPIWVGLALFTVLLTTAAKVGRWRQLFPGAERPRLLPLSRALLVGQLTNALLPVRVGEVARAYAVRARGRISAATALGTVAAEKAFDVLFLLLCSATAALLGPFPAWLNLSLAGFGVVGGALLALAVGLPQSRVVAWVGQWSHRLPGGIEERLDRALTGLAALRRPSMALVACAWSALVWALGAATNYLLFWAFGLHLPFQAAMMLLALLHVGMAPPSSPGRLGVFHAVAVWGLSTLGVDRSSGLAYATVLHAVVYLPQILPGAILLMLRTERQ